MAVPPLSLARKVRWGCMRREALSVAEEGPNDVEQVEPARRASDAVNDGGPGLRRELSGRQIGMIAVGGAIGTGLFLGSGLAISIAGPAVLIAYVIAAFAALTLAYALAEMVVVHPEAGGFGAIAHRYLGGLAGFVQRWLYVAAQSVNIGSEVVAAGLYVQFWYPQLPLWIPVVAFPVIMLAVNAAAVKFFGEFEYWFAMIKVVTIVVFIVLGLTYMFVGLPGQQP